MSKKIVLVLSAAIASVILLTRLRQGTGAPSRELQLPTMQLRKTSIKPSHPVKLAPKCLRKPLEASSKSFYPDWKNFTYQAVDPHHSTGNKSCKKTCKCLQNCVPCFCEGQCCSKVLSRRPYIPSRVDLKPFQRQSHYVKKMTSLSNYSTT